MPTSRVAPGPQIHFTPTPIETAQRQAQTPDQNPGPSSSTERPITSPQHPQQPENQDNPKPHPQEDQHSPHSSPHQPAAVYDPEYTFPPSAKKPGKLRRKISTWRYAVRDYMARIWRECKDPDSWLEERDDSFSMQ